MWNWTLFKFLYFQYHQTIIQEVRAKFPGDNERISRMSIVEENGN